jgi:outer membrane protein
MNKLFVFSGFFFLVCIISILTYRSFFSVTDKIGYVKIGILIEKYDAMKEANNAFKSDLKMAQINYDTVSARVGGILRSKASNGVKSAAEKEFQEYQQKFNADLQKRKQELSGSAINTINDFIEDYGYKHGYRLILGTTVDGNILYARQEDDLTKEILSELNEAYNKRKK